MAQIPELDEAGRKLFLFLIEFIKKVNPKNRATYISYGEANQSLGINAPGRTAGRILQSNGLDNLAKWIEIKELPAITGIIVQRRASESGKENMPSSGYFNQFHRSGSEDEKISWLCDEIEKAKNFDWGSMTTPISLSDVRTVSDINKPAARYKAIDYRIVRDTVMARKIKRINNFKCQICGQTIELADGISYAEAHHIQPLGKPHFGPDIESNLMCLCPNHHVEMDYGVRKIEMKNIISNIGHKIDQTFLDYHNKKIYRR